MQLGKERVSVEDSGYGTSCVARDIFRFVIDLINKLWQAFLPLGAIFIFGGIQMRVDLGWLHVAIACWVLAFLFFLTGFGGLVWAFKAVRAKEREDKIHL
jgi:hypothetical protein